jgi:hypothetical protein
LLWWSYRCATGLSRLAVSWITISPVIETRHRDWSYSCERISFTRRVNG